MLSAFITGLAGPVLSEREAAVLRDAQPCGVILFARNAIDPEQVRRLTDAATAAVGEEIMILIDQEGGRVQRMGPPHWPAYPAGGRIDNPHTSSLARPRWTTTPGSRFDAASGLPVRVSRPVAALATGRSPRL